MIMVVNAAPSMVPATPNFEVTNAAVVEASPAANTWLPLHIAVARMAGTRSPKNRRLAPFSNLLSGEHEGENVGGLATIERRKCSRKRRCAMADRSDATNPTRKEPSP